MNNVINLFPDSDTREYTSGAFIQMVAEPLTERGLTGTAALRLANNYLGKIVEQPLTAALAHSAAMEIIKTA